jgi:hypothetical protein
MDHRLMKLGARPAIPSQLRQTLKLAHYLDSALMTEFVPPEFDWFIGVPDSVDLNDRLGICVVAAEAKTERSWTANANALNVACTIIDADILDVYEHGAGYDPNDPSTDQGWDLLSALAYWQKIGIAGHKIGAYASVNPRHHMMVRAATFLFEGLYIALELPISAQTQDVWDAATGANGTPGSWGGHCVTIQAVLNDQPICRTWGSAQPMTWAFLDKYCSEAYAIISSDYLSGGKTIMGLDVAALNADLRLVQL